MRRCTGTSGVVPVMFDVQPTAPASPWSGEQADLGVQRVRSDAAPGDLHYVPGQVPQPQRAGAYRRLSRAGNRKLNSAPHPAAMSHKRTDPQGIAYYFRKVAEGKGKNGALRCMKRRLSDAIYRTLVEDHARAQAAGQEGHSGATLQSSAPDPTRWSALRTMH